MFSLAYLDCRDTLKSIVDDHPKLIYYMCHRQDSTNFPIQPFIDEQEDCKKLAKHGIMEYKSRFDRSTHSVTFESCKFSRPGKSIARELCQKGVCDELLRLINQIQQNRDITYIDKELFTQAFYEHFSFDEDPQRLVENKLNEIKESFQISLPKNNYEILKNGNVIRIKYSLEEDRIIIDFLIKCTCSEEETKIQNVMDTEFEKDHFELSRPFYVKCEFCNSLFIISHDLFVCKGKIEEFSL